MHPTPPIALKPSAMSSLPLNWQNSVPQASALRGDPREVAGGVLDPDDVGQARQPAIVSTEISVIVRAGTL